MLPQRRFRCFYVCAHASSSFLFSLLLFFFVCTAATRSCDHRRLAGATTKHIEHHCFEQTKMNGVRLSRWLLWAVERVLHRAKHAMIEITWNGCGFDVRYRVIFIILCVVCWRGVGGEGGGWRSRGGIRCAECRSYIAQWVCEPL